MTDADTEDWPQATPPRVAGTTDPSEASGLQPRTQRSRDIRRQAETSPNRADGSYLLAISASAGSR